MAERIKDDDDRILEELFAADAIADGGFSFAVVSKIRRRQRIRRLALPVAIVAGGAVAMNPLLDLVSALPRMIEDLAGPLAALDRLQLPGPEFASSGLLAATLVMALLLVSRILED